ncbi:MAG: TerD family protein [Methylococcales bacterium]|nr:TerD family protein [Methylococcales bacterium]
MVDVLQKGENISLSKFIPALSEIIIVIKWTKKLNNETEFDIDTSAFMLTEQNKVRSDTDFIFYNQPTATNNAIIFKNNLFKISLNAIDKDINKISFVLTLHDAKQKQQHFGLLEKITIEVFNFSDKQKLISYCLTDINTETAIIVGVLYRSNAEWKFRAMGQGYNNGLAVLAKNFGVDIESSEQQNQITPIANNKKTDSTVKSTIENKQEHPTKKPLPPPQKKSNTNPPAPQKTPDLDIHNTDMMTKIDHYAPIVGWLKQRNFQAEVNEAAMDTSGFFDEIAIELGDNYELLKRVVDTIKRRQQGKYDKAYIDLSRDEPKNIETIKKFCKQLYEYAFVAKYFYNSKDKKAVLQLQAATKIINFFNGEWLEWYAVMKIAELCHQRKIKFSCTRNMIIYLSDDNNRYEIDVFFLINDQPLFIECKSGEYREFIDKYTKLRRKLFIPKAQFLMLTSGVDEERVKGLTAMFDISFVNETMLIEHIIDIFVKKKPIAIENNHNEQLKIQPLALKNTKSKPSKNQAPEAQKPLLLKPLETKKTYSNNTKNSYTKPSQVSRNNISKPKSSRKFFVFISIFLSISFLYFLWAFNIEGW